MVFRKENKVDAFQRQISALRQQLGTPEDAAGEPATSPSDSDRRGTPAASGVAEFSGYRTRQAPDSGGVGLGRPIPEVPDEFGFELAPPSAGVPASALDAQTSVVAHDTTWKGDLLTSGSVHVHGRVEGSIEARDDVYVAEEAEVGATVTAANVAIAGTVRGSIRCSSRFEVLPQGRVFGDVQSPTLVVHEGAVINGEFRMGAPDANVEHAATLVRRRATRTGA